MMSGHQPGRGAAQINVPSLATIVAFALFLAGALLGVFLQSAIDKAGMRRLTATECGHVTTPSR